MYFFVIVLILGFGCNLASAFTSFYSEKLGKQAGTFITILLRDIFGIPVWAAGFLLSIKEGGDLFFKSSMVVLFTGWILIISGAAIIVTALVSIKLKAAAPTRDDQLVSKGIYSYVRHPIHCGTFLEFLGLFLFWPTFNVGLACLIGTFWILVQSRFEEKDLLKRMPEYKDYIKKVPAFLPSVRTAGKR